MSRLGDWLARMTGGTPATAKMFVICTIVMCACNGGCVWSANVVTTYAQTILIQADSNDKSANSVARWSSTRGIVCDIAKRLNITEQACARR